MNACASPQLIVFSGIDGAGKSTQITSLTRALAASGHKPVYLWTRGGYTGPFNTLKTIVRKILGKKVLPSGRTVARTKAFRMGWVRTVWLTLAILDLALVYGIYLRWLCLTGRTVIADRYLSDTWIDFTLNFPGADFDDWPLWKLLELVTPQPDHAFLLLIPVEESLRRSKQKDEPFPDSEEVLKQRLAHYTRFSCTGDWHMINCTRLLDDIAAEIASTVTGRSQS
ncbi:MAG: hypothetical protein A2075_16590 [Geobacteraceae bacterium GWC2_58_44]|nr:MAG: hypothetical protein A2075_16590 [Geobacteraceae bacterium GWC2_58_44]HBG05052.1 hypothetical protein [Geobacter sp.]